MINIIGTDANGVKWERINKTQAFKTLLNGDVVGVIPSKINPFTPWEFLNVWDLKGVIYLHSYGWEEEKPAAKICFERACNSYMFYNCNNATGRAIAFYKKIA